MSFSIITDSCANLTNEQVKNYGVKVVSLTYIVKDTEYLGYVEGEETDYKAFYDLLRSKEAVKTSLVSYERVEAALKEALDAGKDVLYLAFSSALSGSCQIVRSCMEDLKDSYPDRKMLLVDTLCACTGQGLLVKYAVEKKNGGASIDETYRWLEDNKLRLVHLFTVDDLFFLKRGGRISGATAVMGTILNFKPLLHVSDEGKLVPYGKTRGRANAINEIVKRMGEVGEDLSEQDIFIAHGDCVEDAETLAQKVIEAYGVKSVTINYIDQVIGSHSGPGTLAIFFLGKER